MVVGATNVYARVSIGQVIDGLYDGPHATPKPSSEGPTFLGIKNLTNGGGLDLSEIRHISEEEFPKWTKRVLPRPGDIVFTYEATLNRYAIIPKGFRGCLGRRLALIRPDLSKVDTHFLYYYFFGEDWRTTISQNTLSGSTVDRIPLTSFREFEIDLPPLSTQHKIASVLSAYDDLIENNTRRIQILEEMAQAIYREWFVNFRFPGHEKVGMVDSPLGKIPEGWEVVSFTDIADVLSGGTPKTSVSEYWNGNISFFTPKDAPTSFYTIRTEKRLTRAGLSKCNSKLYSKDTIFITARGTVGKVAIAAEDMAMNQSCYALRGKDGTHQYFVFLSIKEAVRQLQQQSQGAVFDTIIVDTFRRLKIAKPPMDLVDQLADVIAPVFRQTLDLLHKNRNLLRTRNLLLPKLISGEVDVESAKIEFDQNEVIVGS